MDDSIVNSIRESLDLALEAVSPLVGIALGLGTCVRENSSCLRNIGTSAFRLFAGKESVSNGRARRRDLLRILQDF
jgi:hypothetical protein